MLLIDQPDDHWCQHIPERCKIIIKNQSIFFFLVLNHIFDEEDYECYRAAKTRSHKTLWKKKNVNLKLMEADF